MRSSRSFVLSTLPPRLQASTVFTHCNAKQETNSCTGLPPPKSPATRPHQQRLPIPQTLTPWHRHPADVRHTACTSPHHLSPRTTTPARNVVQKLDLSAIPCNMTLTLSSFRRNQPMRKS